MVLAQKEYFNDKNQADPAPEKGELPDPVNTCPTNSKSQSSVREREKPGEMNTASASGSAIMARFAEKTGLKG